jgi:predicted transposase YdaD
MLGIKLEEIRVYREAQEEKAKAIALNLLKQGFSVEAIAQATELILEQLQQLQAENQ